VFIGYKLGSEKHMTEVTMKKCGSLILISGIKGLALLKTTKVGCYWFTTSVCYWCTTSFMLYNILRMLPRAQPFLM